LRDSTATKTFQVRAFDANETAVVHRVDDLAQRLAEPRSAV
jgi:hypothetical protein